MTDEHLVLCTNCNGTGRTVLSHVRYADGTGASNVRDLCTMCQGRGAVPAITRQWSENGKRCRERRVGAAIGVREMAARLGLSAPDVSHMEWGRADPARLVEFWAREDGKIQNG